MESPLFCPLKRRKDSDGHVKPVATNAIYEIVMRHARTVGINTVNFHPHSLRATFATNTLSNHADLGKVQDYLGHASVCRRPEFMTNLRITWQTPLHSR